MRNPNDIFTDLDLTHLITIVVCPIIHKGPRSNSVINYYIYTA
jgi:hypothetical protein